MKIARVKPVNNQTSMNFGRNERGGESKQGLNVLSSQHYSLEVMTI